MESFSRSVRHDDHRQRCLYSFHFRSNCLLVGVSASSSFTFRSTSSILRTRNQLGVTPQLMVCSGRRAGTASLSISKRDSDFQVSDTFQSSTLPLHLRDYLLLFLHLRLHPCSALNDPFLEQEKKRSHSTPLPISFSLSHHTSLLYLLPSSRPIK